MPRGRGGRGGGSGRGGGGSGGSLPREVQISKAMSWLLRHGAKGEGIKMDEGGWVCVADLLSYRKISALRLTFPELQSIVATNDKQRFAMIPISPSTPSTTSPTPPSSSSPPTDASQYLIRATQGHSLAIDSSNLLTPILPTDTDFPALVVHGTNEGAWRGIQKSGGLKRMSRRHVHFARGMPGALDGNKQGGKDVEGNGDADGGCDDIVLGGGGGGGDGDGGRDEKIVAPTEKVETKVVSGMRANATIMIWVDVARSIHDGSLKWWRSENGVVLTEGDDKGMVSMQWFDRVEVRGTREVLWRRGEGEEGGNR